MKAKPFKFTTIYQLLNDTVRACINDNIFSQGAALSYYTIFAIAPLFIIALTIPDQVEAEKIVPVIERIAKGIWSQFGATILKEPIIGKIESPENDAWKYLRVEFKIWPDQGSLIETTFRQRLAAAMKTFDTNYADWMVTVTYRTIEKREPAAGIGLDCEQKMPK